MRTSAYIERPRFYFLVGNNESWKVSISNGLWGFNEKTRGLWELIESGEYVGYYVTNPLKKIIGFGKFGEKFENSELVWKQEIESNESIWRYKIKLNHLFVVKTWDEGLPLTTKVNVRSSRPVIKKEDFVKYVKEGEKSWNIDLQMKF